MRLAEAKKIVAGPLAFGNAEQIDAVAWLHLFEEINQSGAECHQCEGTGTCECSDCEKEHKCGVCAGTGNFKLSEVADYSLKQLRELFKECEEAANDN